MRGGKQIPLKTTVDKALADCKDVRSVLVVQRTAAQVSMVAGRDEWLEEAMKGVASTCLPVMVDSEHPLFLLYTSGSTGKPKGVRRRRIPHNN